MSLCFIVLVENWTFDYYDIVTLDVKFFPFPWFASYFFSYFLKILFLFLLVTEVSIPLIKQKQNKQKKKTTLPVFSDWLCVGAFEESWGQPEMKALHLFLGCNLYWENG